MLPKLTVEQQTIIRNRIAEKLSDLLDTNLERAMEQLHDSDDSKLKLGVSITLDFGSVPAKIVTKLSYSKTVSDERVIELDDPDQFNLPLLEEEKPVTLAESEDGDESDESEDQPKPKKRGRKKKN